MNQDQARQRPDTNRPATLPRVHLPKNERTGQGCCRKLRWEGYTLLRCKAAEDHEGEHQW